MDSGATYCTSCGHLLGVGRFCTNCGQPIAGRHSDVATAPTVTTPAQSVPVVPAAGVAPPPARYPLFADETTPPRPSAAPLPPAPPPPPTSEHRDRRWLIGIGVLATLVVVAAFAILSMISGEDDGRADDPTPAEGQPADRDDRGSEDGSPDPGPRDPGDISGQGTAAAPVTAPDSTDQQTGEPVTFGAANLLDGDPTTAWRMPGDGTGTELTISFDEPMVVTEVGLINGYAKVYRGYNGYAWNRRVLSVSWVFDDGSTVPQELADDRRVQSVEIEPVTTQTIRLQIVAVSPVPRVAQPKDYTPISEIAIGGSPS